MKNKAKNKKLEQFHTVNKFVCVTALVSLYFVGVADGYASTVNLSTIRFTFRSPMTTALGSFSPIDIRGSNNFTVSGNYGLATSGKPTDSSRPSEQALTVITEFPGKSNKLGLDGVTVDLVPGFSLTVAAKFGNRDTNENSLTLTGSNSLYGVKGLYGAVVSNTAAMDNVVRVDGDLIIGNTSTIAGAYVREGTVANNSVELQGKNIEVGIVAGGTGWDSSAYSNTVAISVENGTFSSVYGGYAIGLGDSLNNSVIIHSSASSSELKFKNITGGSGSKASTNYVEIGEGVKLNVDVDIFGGDARHGANVEAKNNLISIRGTGVIQGSIYGGYATPVSDYASGNSFSNKVEIDSQDLAVGNAYGGHGVKAKYNVLVLNGATVVNDSVGGYGSNEASENQVYIGEAKLGNVYGGHGKSSVKDNIVLIKNSVVNQSVYGGHKSSGDGEATGNIVLIDGNTTVAKDVYGAYSEGCGDLVSANNSVSLSGNVTVSGGVYAAYDRRKRPTGNNNELVFSGRIKAGTIGGFTDLHLLAGSVNQIASGNEYLLTITGENSLDLTQKNIDVYDLKNSISTLGKGEKIGLIRVVPPQSGSSPVIKLNGPVTLHNTFIDKKWNVKNDTAGELYLQGEGLVVLPPSGPDDGGVVIKPSTQANINSESLSQNRLASISLINQGASFVADSGIRAIRGQQYGKNVFFVSEGGMNKYEHGFNKIELNGASLITGFMNNFSGTLFGTFFEASWGHAGSKESFFSAKSNLQSYGGGLLVNKTFGSKLDVDGSLRFGWLENSFKGRYFDVNGASDFKTRMAYASAHVGAAYHLPITESIQLSPYARYIASYVGGDEVDASNVEDDKYKANSTVTHTVRAGLRVKTKINQRVNIVAGCAIDETMGAKAKGRVSGYDLKTLSVNGATGIGEIKVHAAPALASSWNFEAGLTGYIGERRGVVGEASINYRF